MAFNVNLFQMHAVEIHVVTERGFLKIDGDL